ncbi:MAG TPA: enoyl-CoA hydratase-related protein [Vicinamibacterales bacterium]|nr:enoyl-CoA hydratase-related protein [Vicinamibacterales bacterium]
MPSTLTIATDGGVARVTLNRPDVRNAFNETLIAELTAWAARVRQAEPIRAAVLAGAGRAFCAGADLTWMSRMVGYSMEENLEDARAAARLFQILNALPVPLIGRVQGAALGGGAGLAAVCDIVVAADDAVFGFTEAKLGILPSMIAPFVIAKIGQSAARDLFLTASRFPAARAREIGLVHYVVPAADLDATIERLLAEVLTSAPGAVSAAKALIPAVAGRAPEDVFDLTTATIARHRTSREGQDGMRAFLEKRKAPWVP